MLVSYKKLIIRFFKSKKAENIRTTIVSDVRAALRGFKPNLEKQHYKMLVLM